MALEGWLCGCRARRRKMVDANEVVLSYLYMTPESL